MVFECGCEVSCYLCYPCERGSAYWAFVGGEVVLEGFLGWSVWVKSEYVSKKVESAFLEFLTEGSFFGEVVEVLVADFLGVYVVEADSE